MQTHMTTSECGKLVPEFLLRCDFPDELCWTDSVQHTLHSPKGYRTQPEANRCDHETVLDQLWQATPGPYMGYFGWICGKRLDPIYVMYDGVRYVHVAYEGLFSALCTRVNTVMGLSVDAPCPILPHNPERRPGPHGPAYFVYHDRERSNAKVLPFALVYGQKWLPWMIDGSEPNKD